MVIIFFLVLIAKIVFGVGSFILSILDWIAVAVSILLLVMGAVLLKESLQYMLRGASIAILSFIASLIKIFNRAN